jgi:hypothetical protein
VSRTQFAGLLIGLGLTFSPTGGNAHAQAFGTDEKMHTIQPTKDPKYTLCYKTSIFFFILGCYVKDDGYVLCPVGESKKYIPLDAAKIQQLQQEGILPTPLPPYSLSFWEYLFGYSNWITLAVVVGFFLIKWARGKAKGPQAPEPLPGPT